jgi:predicted AAA+ superfamily ATPase
MGVATAVAFVLRAFLAARAVIAAENLAVRQQLAVLQVSVNLETPGAHLGTLLEAFVYQELRKQITWSGTQPLLDYYRMAGNREVDFVLQRRNGQLIGLEVKTAVKLNSDDVKGIADLAATAGKHFRAGIVLPGLNGRALQ